MSDNETFVGDFVGQGRYSVSRVDDQTVVFDSGIGGESVVWIQAIDGKVVMTKRLRLEIPPEILDGET